MTACWNGPTIGTLARPGRTVVTVADLPDHWRTWPRVAATPAASSAGGSR